MEDENKKTNNIEENKVPRSHKLIVVVAILFVVLTILFIAFLFFLNSSGVKMSSLFSSVESTDVVVADHTQQDNVQDQEIEEFRMERDIKTLNHPIGNSKDESVYNSDPYQDRQIEESSKVATTNTTFELRSVVRAMYANQKSAKYCSDRGGTVLSGHGQHESPVCSEEVPGTTNIISWINPVECGVAEGSTTWTVFNGDTQQWDFTVECKDFTACNGPNRAICNAQGCQLHCEDTDNQSMLTIGMMDIRMEAIACRSRGGTVLSSDRSSNAVLCSIAGNDDPILWPQYDFCGTERGDTKWLVQTNSANEWTYTVECKNFTECNGLQGAFCNSDRCVFHCTED